ncbi:hypothetical protein PAXRUDRAFT_88225, partial [Paxillus rubicundulus Ve08.2h10]
NVNIQHDCMVAMCSGLRRVREQQEHVATTRMKTVTKHAAVNAYILNMHALHNYHRIAAVVP